MRKKPQTALGTSSLCAKSDPLSLEIAEFVLSVYLGRRRLWLKTTRDYFPSSGGFYDLQLELGPRSDTRVKEVMRFLWDLPGFRGPYEFRDRPPSEQLVWNNPGYTVGVNYSGLTTIPHRNSAACVALCYRVDSGDKCCDVFEFSLSMEALEGVYDVGSYPFGDTSDSQKWRPELDSWYLSIAHQIHRHMSVLSGSIGFELPLLPREDEREPYNGYLTVEDGVLKWLPPKRYDL
jgi:hypothetical protein